MNGIEATARALSYYRNLHQVTASNLAQVSTTGYKAARLAAPRARTGNEPVAVAWTDWKQGALTETRRKLDVALDGPGFLVVRTEHGERLTRGGSLELGPDGQLIDLSGHPVLAEGGEVLLFDGNDDLRIQEDGWIVVNGKPEAKLRVETVSDLSRLRREEGGLWAPTEKPVPVMDGTVRVRQGWLEGSNVDPVDSLIDLIDISRAYAANSQVLKALDGALGIAATEVGNTR